MRGMLGAMRSRWFVLVVVAGGCSIFPTKANPDYCRSNNDCDPGSICNLDSHGCEAPPDADPDANTARCDPQKPFEAPTLVPAVNDGFLEISFTMTDDELHAFLVSDHFSFYLQQTTSRASREEDFPTPTPDPHLAAVGNARRMWPARDGLLLFFERQGKPYVARRASISSDFDSGSAILVDTVALASLGIQPGPDALTLYWLDSGDAMLRSAPNFAEPWVFRAASRVSTMAMDAALLSADELALYYLPAGGGGIHVSTRFSTAQAFEPGTLVPSLSGVPSSPLFLTKDQCLIYLTSGSGPTSEIHVARRPR